MTLQIDLDLNTITQDAKEQLQLLQGRGQQAQTMVVNSDAEYQMVAGLLVAVKTRYKLLEEKRKSYTKPLRDLTKTINDDFRPAIEECKQAEAGLKKALADYQNRQLAAQQQALLEAQKAVAQPETFNAMMAVAQQATAPEAKGISTRRVWKFEVTSPGDVPREFLMVDTAKLGKAVRTLKENASIPGVRVWPEDNIAARSK